MTATPSELATTRPDLEVVLIDIEGTVGSISFVRDTLFPYSRTALEGLLEQTAGTPDEAVVRDWFTRIAVEHDLGDNSDSDAAVVSLLQTWIDEDRKHTGLKALQGIMWKQGYIDGQFQAPVYADAHTGLQRWFQRGLRLAVFSSGSVPAQHLFFGYSSYGDLRPLFSGYFDTTTGTKGEARAYENIALGLRVDPAAVVFLSDVIEELDAARSAGMGTVLIDRRDDYPEARLDSNGHQRVESFDELG